MSLANFSASKIADGFDNHLNDNHDHLNDTTTWTSTSTSTSLQETIDFCEKQIATHIQERVQLESRLQRRLDRVETRMNVIMLLLFVCIGIGLIWFSVYDQYNPFMTNTVYDQYNPFYGDVHDCWDTHIYVKARFVSEFGWQSWPAYSTMKQF
eukprot:326512_1